MQLSHGEFNCTDQIYVKHSQSKGDSFICHLANDKSIPTIPMDTKICFVEISIDDKYLFKF